MGGLGSTEIGIIALGCCCAGFVIAVAVLIVLLVRRNAKKAPNKD